MARQSTWLLIAIGMLCADSAACLGQGRNVTQLIDELKVGSVGHLELGVRFSLQMLEESKRAEDEIRADIDEVRGRVDAGEGTASDWLHLTDLYEELDDPHERRAARERAVELYEEEFAARPQDPEVLVSLSRLLTDSGEFERAEQLAARAVEIDPQNLDAHDTLIESLTRQATPFSQWMQRMSEELPEGVDMEGITPEQLADPNSEASARLAAILRDAAPLLHEAFLEVQKTPTVEEVAERKAVLDRAETVLEQARPPLLKRLEDEPTPALFRQYAGIEESVAGARFWFEYSRLRLLMAGAQPPQPMQMMQAVFSALSMHDVREAGQRLCKTHPDDLGIRALVGSLQAMTVVRDVLLPLLQEEGEPPDTAPEETHLAIENLSAALALPPERREGVPGALALMHLVAGDHAAVLKVMDDAAQRREWDAVAGSAALLATLRLMIGDIATMVQEEGSPLDGPTQEEMKALEERFAGWIDKTGPEDASAFGNLAGLRARIDDWEGVAEALERSRQIDSSHAVRARGLGVAYLKLGRHEEAAKILEEALKLDFKGDEEAEADCHHAYGVALLALGKPGEAEKELVWEAGQE